MPLNLCLIVVYFAPNILINHIGCKKTPENGPLIKFRQNWFPFIPFFAKSCYEKYQCKRKKICAVLKATQLCRWPAAPPLLSFLGCLGKNKVTAFLSSRKKHLYFNLDNINGERVTVLLFFSRILINSSTSHCFKSMTNLHLHVRFVVSQLFH